MSRHLSKYAENQVAINESIEYPNEINIPTLPTDPSSAALNIVTPGRI